MKKSKLQYRKEALSKVLKLNRKAKMLNVRLTTREKLILKEKAQRRRMSLSQLIREYCKSNR